MYFSLSHFYLPGPFNFISPILSLGFSYITCGYHVGSRNRIWSHSAGRHKRLMQVPVLNRLKNIDSWWNLLIGEIVFWSISWQRVWLLLVLWLLYWTWCEERVAKYFSRFQTGEKYILRYAYYWLFWLGGSGCWLYVVSRTMSQLFTCDLAIWFWNRYKKLVTGKTRHTEKEVGRQHQGMDRPGGRQVPERIREQRKMEETGSEVICGATTTPARLRGRWRWKWLKTKTKIECVPRPEVAPHGWQDVNIRELSNPLTPRAKTEQFCSRQAISGCNLSSPRSSTSVITRNIPDTREQPAN